MLTHARSSLDKRSVLLELIEQLGRLIVMLKMEPDMKRQYASFFEYYLDQAKALAVQEFTFSDLRELSTALEGLMNRNFLDYSPAVSTDQPAGLPRSGARNNVETISKNSLTHRKGRKD